MSKLERIEEINKVNTFAFGRNCENLGQTDLVKQSSAPQVMMFLMNISNYSSIILHYVRER